jgi:hypothetical protein
MVELECPLVAEGFTEITFSPYVAAGQSLQQTERGDELYMKSF